MTPKPGRDLEQLVESLERALTTNNCVSIESPCKMKDKVTGNLREHDVVLHIRQSHHCMDLAIECRDRNSKVKVSEVEAFNQKCHDTGVDKGVMVSSKGFDRTVLAKAARYNIRCLTLAEAQNLGWLRTDHVALTTRSLTNVHLHFYPKSPFNLPGDMAPYDLVHPVRGGVALDRFMTLINKALDRVQRETGELPPSPVRIRFDADGMSVRHKQTGESVPLSHVEADVSFEITNARSPLKTFTYGDADSRTPGIQVALADVDIGQFHGKLVVTKKAGENRKVVLVPAKKGNRSSKA